MIPALRISRRPVQRIVAFALVLSAAGCSGGKMFQKQETIHEGAAAEQRAAQAQMEADAAAGTPGSTPSPIPSLVPGEGRVQLPAKLDAPPTAPPADKFDNSNAGHLLARCRDRSQRKEWFDAIGDCRRSAELSPGSIEPWVELMRMLVEVQSYVDAADAAGHVLAANPNDSIALYYLAWSFRGRSKYPEAISALERAMAADPKRIQFVQALAVTYRLAGDYGKSIRTLDQALKMSPGDAHTQSMLKEIQAELAEKLAPYRKLVREKPDSSENQAALGFMYQKYGLSQQALGSYDIALSQISKPDADPETKKLAASIYYNRGVVYRNLGSPEQCEPALTQSMKLDPSLESFAWYYIGLCRYDLGKYDTSIEALKKSVEMSPDVFENRSALADAFTKAGKTDLATEQRNAATAIQARVDADKAAAARERSVADEAQKAAAANAAATAAQQPAMGASIPSSAPSSGLPATAPVVATPVPQATPPPAAAKPEAQDGTN